MTNNIHVVTHDGKFHPDEIYACVLLAFFKNAKIRFTRTRDEKKLERYKNKRDVYVIDVGGEYHSSMLNFDHHQSTFNAVNANGNVMSSCGLIFKYLKGDIDRLPKSIATKIETFVDNLDKHDNGVEYFREVEFISLYNSSASKHRFLNAFKAACTHFQNLLGRWYEEYRMELLEEEVLDSLQDGVLYSDDMISITPRMNANPNAKVLVAKRNDAEYCIKSLNEGEAIDFSMRCPAPESWRGLSGRDLEQASGFDGMVFSHKSGFLTIVKGNKDQAVAVARYIVENQGH